MGFFTNKTKTFTLREFIDAIERNGLPQDWGSLWRDTRGSQWYPMNNPVNAHKIGSACAMGQGLLNLGVIGVSPTKDVDLKSFNEVEETIIYLNDDEMYPIPDIVAFIREKYHNWLDIKLTGQEVDFTPFLSDDYVPKDN